jgi:glutamate-5-semialdehyde dehydrogenase
MSDVLAKTQAAKEAAIELATLTTERRDDALNAMADAIWRNRPSIIHANEKDLSVARELLSRGEMKEAVIQRLKMDEDKIADVVEMVRSVERLGDPIGKTQYTVELDEGLELYRVSSPIGVVGVVFESRPDALAQIAALCLKSGNAVIMKGGSEAKHSNQALFDVIRHASGCAGVPEGWIQLLESRDDVSRLLELHDYVNLIIPRGSNNFVEYIMSHTKIPVLGHSEGVCHVYVDKDASVGKAVEVCLDSKVQYPSVCNALDCILVHVDKASVFLSKIVERYSEAGVEVRGCPRTFALLGDKIKRAAESDWGHEYLDYKVAIKVVDSCDEAINHINGYGSHHTDAIITENAGTATTFMKMVDSAGVFWNASTRFSDGYRYGLGAEVGISTGKIHARGPTGLEGLTIYKYYLIGSGQTVGSYVGEGGRRFTHRKLGGGWLEGVERMRCRKAPKA